MSTITTIQSTDLISASRSTINTNFANLNTDKAELSGATFTGDINVPDEAYGAGWNGSTEVPTKNAVYDEIETKQDTLVSGTNIKTVNGNSLLGSGDITISGGGSVATDAIWDAKGDLAVGTGANTASRLAVGSNGQILVADSAEATGLKWANATGGGDMLAATYDPANIAQQVVGTTATQTLTNKTLTAPRFADLGFIADQNGNEMLAFNSNASAVNYIELENSATGSAVHMRAKGDDMDVGLHLVAKGATGYVNINDSTDETKRIRFNPSGNSTGVVTTLASVDTASGTKTLPTGTTTLVGTDSTQTLTNKDISSATNTYRSASDTTTGAVELATAAETTTGTDATRAVTPDGLAGSEFGKRTVSVLLSGSASGDSALATGDGLAAVPVDTTLNGMNLVAIKAYVTTVSSSGAPLFQVRRSRRSSATARTTVDMLTTGVSIDASEFESADATTAAVINTSNDDVQTGDILLFDCDTAGTGTKGAQILLTFQLP